jgi:hypothetical protein
MLAACRAACEAAAALRRCGSRTEPNVANQPQPLLRSEVQARRRSVVAANSCAAQMDGLPVPTSGHRATAAALAAAATGSGGGGSDIDSEQQEGGRARHGHSPARHGSQRALASQSSRSGSVRTELRASWGCPSPRSPARRTSYRSNPLLEPRSSLQSGA